MFKGLLSLRTNWTKLDFAFRPITFVNRDITRMQMCVPDKQPGCHCGNSLSTERPSVKAPHSFQNPLKSRLPRGSALNLPLIRIDGTIGTIPMFNDANYLISWTN